MSCGPGNPTFRLLDTYVGWDPDPVDGSSNLAGLEDPEGLRLALENPGEIDAGELLARIPPPRLARGCDPCDWYLVTPAPSRLMHLDRCSGRWLPISSNSCDPALLRDAVAVAASGHRIAVADRAAGVVHLWTGDGVRPSATIQVQGVVGPIAFSVRGELWVTVEGTTSILRFGLTGDAHGEFPVPVPAGAGRVDRLAVAGDRTVWLVTRAASGALQLWQAACADRQFQTAGIAELAAAFEATGLTADAEGLGFCLSQSGPEGAPVERCFSWYGRPVNAADIPRPMPPRRETQGQLLTRALDSGIPRCQWHRVRIAADLPPHTSLTVAVSTSEQNCPPDQGKEAPDDPQWFGFAPGRPHPLDWQTVPAGSVDFLVKQPPGRYLFVRLRLTGDGVATPEVRCVRLDFPRSTSLEFLPPVYRENQDAEDFTERFLSLFDATISDLDRAIERYPALLDPEGIPDEILPWLGSFLDVAFDPLWEPARRRKILQAAPRLYQKRGTLDGLKMAFKLIFDVEPAIQELAAERNWGILGHRTGPRSEPNSGIDELRDTPTGTACRTEQVAKTVGLGTALLRGMRLFGRSRTRFRLGNSPLSKATIKSYGNPDHDPLDAGAYRFRVLVPFGPLGDKNLYTRMEQLVESQKPSHTVATVRFGGGFVLGQWCAVGVDTVFAAPPQPILGSQGNVRLRGMTVLWPGRGGRKTGIVPGQSSRIGIETVVE